MKNNGEIHACGSIFFPKSSPINKMLDFSELKNSALTSFSFTLFPLGSSDVSAILASGANLLFIFHHIIKIESQKCITKTKLVTKLT